MRYVLLCFLSIGCIRNKTEKIEVSSYIDKVNGFLTSEYNNEIVFYVDLSRFSGDFRFFVIDLRNKMILTKGLCCNGETNSSGEVLYSNEPGSNCSSQGLYSIGGSYIGKFGKAYRLNGLQNTNSMAIGRAIVLHAHNCVPSGTSNFNICHSQGCPTVNPDFFNKLNGYLINSKKPVLMYIQ